MTVENKVSIVLILLCSIFLMHHFLKNREETQHIYRIVWIQVIVFLAK